jgi:dUTP pyrophosphatase
MVILHMVTVNKGDRIAQLVLEKICTPEVEVVEELDCTIRGQGGFGSTGLAKK